MGLIGSRIWMRRVKGRHDQYIMINIHYICVYVYMNTSEN